MEKLYNSYLQELNELIGYDLDEQGEIKYIINIIENIETACSYLKDGIHVKNNDFQFYSRCGKIASETATRALFNNDIKRAKAHACAHHHFNVQLNDLIDSGIW